MLCVYTHAGQMGIRLCFIIIDMSMSTITIGIMNTQYYYYNNSIHSYYTIYIYILQ